MTTSPETDQELETQASTDEDTFDTVAFAEHLATLLWERKALNTRIIDLRGRVSYTDFILIATGTGPRHVQAIAKFIEDEMRELGYRPMGREGVDSGSWGLIDFGDAIVHLFDAETRQEFDLEGMWADAPRLELEDKPNELYGHFALRQFED